MNINSHPCDFLLYAPLLNSSQKPVDLFAVEGPDEVAGHVQAKGHIISWWDSGQPQVLGMRSGQGRWRSAEPSSSLETVNMIYSYVSLSKVAN